MYADLPAGVVGVRRSYIPECASGLLKARPGFDATESSRIRAMSVGPLPRSRGYLGVFLIVYLSPLALINVEL